MQSQSRNKPPVGIVFDSDMGNGVDDVLTLAMLYGFQGKKDAEARIISVSVSTSNLRAAAFCDAVGRFYGEIRDSELPPRFRRRRALPIGLAIDGRMSEEAPMLAVPLSKRNEQGEPLYGHDIHKLNDTAEVAALIRNALTAQHDQNSVVVLAGPATNLVRILDLPGVKDLISSKVRFLSIAGGAYADSRPEFNIKSDVAAARKLFAEWPTPIVAAGYEVGVELPYPASSIEQDFAWAQAHPIVDAYRAYQEMPYDAPSWAMAAVLYAVRPHGGYFKLSAQGTISVLDDGRTEFTQSQEGKHRHLIVDSAQKERVIQAYRELASAKPAARDVPP